MTVSSAVEMLLVEDNPHDLELILRALKRRNLTNQVRVVRDGAEALDFLFGTGACAHRGTEETPKVVVLDLKLPKVGGLEVLRRLRADPRTKFLPVVVLSSSQEERDILDCYQAGANSYVVKAIDSSELAQGVAEVGVYWVTRNRAPR